MITACSLQVRNKYPHWCDGPERFLFKFVVMTLSCVHRQAPQYLSVVTSIAACQSLALRHHSICDLSVVDFSSYRGIIQPMFCCRFICGWSVGQELVITYFAWSRQ